MIYPRRINKYLRDKSFASRHEADRLIDAGMVMVNGKKAKQGMMIGEKDVVSVKNTQGYYDIESSVLIQMLKNKNFSLVNVHIPYAGELANTDTFIPYDAIRQNLGNLPTDKNAKIVLYCRSGSMSAAAAKELATLGYTNVYNLAGGMNEWEKEGNAVIRK